MARGRLVSAAQCSLRERPHPAPARATKGLQNYGGALLQGFLFGSIFVEEQRGVPRHAFSECVFVDNAPPLAIQFGA